ncbi:aspartate racemase, partial [Pseudomonas syringae pv. tagetis]
RKDNQALQMATIYPDNGIKPRLTDGICKDQILPAAEQKCELAAQVLILGSTEQPIVLEQSESNMKKNYKQEIDHPKTILEMTFINI